MRIANVTIIVYAFNGASYVLSLQMWMSVRTRVAVPGDVV